MERPDSPRAWIADYMDQGRDRDAHAGGNAGSAGGCGGRADESRASKRLNSSTNHSRAAPRPPTPITSDNPATGDATSEVEAIEADTEDPEDIPDLNALLLPSGALPLDVERFSVSYSAALLAGWVKQGSPCCAAASVAGAWNALGGRARGAPGALNSDLVLSVMRAVVEEQVAGMVARFERLLQGSLEPLLRALATELALEGKHLGGKGPKSTVANGPHLLRLTRSITSRERERAGHSATFDLLWDLYEEERKEAAEAAAAATAAAAAETVAEVMSAGTAAAATARAGGGSCATSGCARQGRMRDGKENGVVSRNSHEGGTEREASRQSTSGISAEATVTDTAEAGADKVPRRPSTGNCRVRSGGGATTASAESRPGKTLRRPRSAGDLAPTGSGGDCAWEGAEGLGPARACWVKEDIEEEEEEDEEEEEEDEDDEEEEPEELGGRTAPAHRRRSSSGGGGDGRKGGSKERARRRKSGKKALPFRRGSGGGPGALPSTRWRWKKDLCALLKRMGGLDKVMGPPDLGAYSRCQRSCVKRGMWRQRDLNPATHKNHTPSPPSLSSMRRYHQLCMARPSTGCIGNLGLISTVRYLDGQTPGNVEVCCVCCAVCAVLCVCVCVRF